jgi:hypothetical protein
MRIWLARLIFELSAGVRNIITVTDEGDSSEEGKTGEEPKQPAASRSIRKPARDERDRHFERIEKVLYWVRRTRVAKLAPDRFLTAIDYLINLNMQYRDHRRALAGFRCVQDAIEDYFLRLSISEMLEVCQGRYASMRDAARQHGQLDRLRASLLTLSVDMSSIDRDIRAYNERGWQRDYAQFFFEDAPFLVAERDEHGSESRQSINMNEHLLNEQMGMLETLRAADNDYRGILTAAASLTSSLQSIRLAKAAIWVALSSLGVAAVTLLIADISKHSLFVIVAHWLGLLH